MPAKRKKPGGPKKHKELDQILGDESLTETEKVIAIFETSKGRKAWQKIVRTPKWEPIFAKLMGLRGEYIDWTCPKSLQFRDTVEKARKLSFEYEVALRQIMQPESALPNPNSAAENQEREEREALANRHPWTFLSPAARADAAVSALAERVATKGDLGEVRYLLNIIRKAIRAIERCPQARELMAGAAEWPAMVPGGPESGPLWKAWAEMFASRQVGSKNNRIPKDSGADFAFGKPARLAWTCFKHLEELRLSGPDPLLAQRAAAGVMEREPKYMTKARSVPPLSKDSVSQWADLALASLEAGIPDWIFWMNRLPGRAQTAETRARKKSLLKDAAYDAAKPVEVDPQTAKGMVREALRRGFVKLSAALKKPPEQA